MADRIGAYRNIIPVISRPNAPPDTTPEPETPDGTIRWSKTSTFHYSTLEIDPPKPGGKVGVTVRHPPIHVFETRIEEFPAAVMWKTEEYDVLIHTGGGSLLTNEAWVEAWCLLTSETQKEIIGYTAYKGGQIQERYKSREVEYYAHFIFDKHSLPRRKGIYHTYGELP